MIKQSFELTADKLIKEIPFTSIPSPPKPEGPPVWINITERDPDELVSLLSSQSAHPLTIEACLEITPIAPIVAYGESLFISLPTCSDADAENRAFLSIICVSGVIITIHEKPIFALREVISQYVSARKFVNQSSAAILYEIFDHLIDQDIIFARKTREQVDQLEAAVDEELAPDLSHQTISLKRQAARLESILEDQLHCVSAFRTHKSEAFSLEGLHDHFRDAVAHLDHASRSIDRQEARLAAIHQEYLLKLQDRTNHRLQILTVISAIFLPLTLITGVYGMNFRQMPELEWRYGYPFVLTVMVLISGALLILLRRKRWF